MNPGTPGYEKAFAEVFLTYVTSLHAYAFRYVRDADQAEEMVQAVFARLWEKGSLLKIDKSAQAFLYRCVRNECLNYLAHSRQIQLHRTWLMQTVGDDLPGEPAAQKAAMSELSKRLALALGKLPARCRTIFELSRYDNLTYAEIAQRLGLSVKTVEAQMGKALRILRHQLQDFL